MKKLFISLFLFYNSYIFYIANDYRVTLIGIIYCIVAMICGYLLNDLTRAIKLGPKSH